MPYAVIAPGIHTVYDDYSSVERIMALYPYPKFRKFSDEKLAWEFVRRHENKHAYTYINKYGDTFNKHFVKMEYFIGENSVYYNFRTQNLGYIKIISDKALVENRANLIKAELKNTSLNNEMITGHLIAIYHGLSLIGEFIDVDVTVPDHSIFYALMTYKGSNKVILRVLEQIRNRMGKLSVTMPDLGQEEITTEEDE